MNHSLIFDGVDIRDYHAYIFQQNVYDAPAREYTRIDVPGRNGQLLIDEGRYPNITQSYGIILMDGFRQHIDRLRGFLLSRIGYKRLEDTYHPDEFYQAFCTQAIEVRTTSQTDAGKFFAAFERTPQRWLKSGEKVHVCEDSLTLVNPEYTIAKPLIRVYGSGSFTVGDDEVVLYFAPDEAPDYVDIDSEIDDVYCGAENYSSNIVLLQNRFPVLLPGENEITCGEGITRLEIIPRWWRL